MKRQVTISDVARRAGVSKSAVSHAINGRTDISAPVRERILKAADELRWRPAAAATALAESRSRTIGYVVRRDPRELDRDPYFGEVVAGVQPALTKDLYTLLVSVVGSVEEELAVYRRLIESRQVDGFLLIDHRRDDPRYELLVDAGLPAVAIGQPQPGTPFPSVTASPTAITDVMTMLVRAHHRCIGYVADPSEFSHSGIRRTQVQQAARELGLPRVRTRAAALTPRGATKATDSLLSLTPSPTAIMYANDWLAMWGMDAIRAKGLTVPGDVSVIGYDDVPPAAWSNPPLTTIHVDVAQIASTAATALLDVFAGRPVQALPGDAHLVIRKSTGPAPSY